MKCEDTFGVVKEIINNPDSNAIISTFPIVDLPVNTPPNVANKIIIQKAQSSLVNTRSVLKQKVLIGEILTLV